jgi:hypothetical protein
VVLDDVVLPVVVGSISLIFLGSVVVVPNVHSGVVGVVPDLEFTKVLSKGFVFAIHIF